MRRKRIRATTTICTVTIQASDGGANTTATKAVTIDLTNVEEPGTVTLSTLQPQVGRALTATLDDPDDQTESTITWQWYRGSSPISGAIAGANMNTSTYEPDAGDVGSRLRATAMYDDVEGDDKTARQDSHRTVRSAPDANTAPTFPDQNPNTQDVVETAQEREVAENTPAATNLGAPIAANDPGDVLTYSIETTGDAASFSINRATGQLQTKEALDYEDNANREFMVTVTATDPFGSPATSVVTITVTDVNEAPILTAEAVSIDVAENGTDLDDDDPADVMEGEFTVADEDAVDTEAALKWSLSGADASKFDISTTGGATRTLSLKEAPDYEAPGDSGRDNVYEVTVVVTDTKGNSDEQDVTVKVTNVEEPGAVTLSTLQPRVDIPVTATLADADNITADSVSWQWYKGTVTQQGLETLDNTECVDARTSDCFIKGATSATYTPVAFDVNDLVIAVALYTDGSPNEGNAEDFAMAATNQQVLAETRNKAPVFPDQDAEMEGDQTDQERSVMENAPMIGGNNAILDLRIVGAPVLAVDVITMNDGMTVDETLTYSLGGPDAASFTIDRGTAQISTKADVPLDTETKDTYTVTVTATDPSRLSATITVTITVTNVDEAPEIMLGGLVISGMRTVDYTENGTGAVETYMVSGPDAALARWSLEGDDAGDFDISSSGVLTFRNSPDFGSPADADTDNDYMVTLKASDGTYMDTLEVTVTVVADADEVPTTISGLSDVRYAENGTDAVATYTLAGTHAASATLSLSGADAGDFTISDGMLTFKESPDYEMPADADMDNTYMVTVNAGDATYDVTIMVIDVDEVPTIEGDATIDYAENGTDDVATYTAMDPEGTEFSWALSGIDAGVFDISGAGVLTFNESPDYEMPADADTDNTYMVTVNAGDATYDVTIMVTGVDEVPTIEGDATIDYAENGTGDVATFTAMDPEGTAISWALSGIDAGVFDISVAGMLTFNESPDYEMSADADTDNTYMVTVNADDATYDVIIMVTDVDEVPTIEGDATIDYAENGTGDVATFTAMDPEGTAISWALSGIDAGVFDISAAGMLTFKESPDYEMPADADTDNTYVVTIHATDVTMKTGAKAIMVMVTDVDEVPTIEGDATIDYAENGTGDVATFTAMDPEGTAISWALSGIDAGVFDISAAGMLTFNESPDYEMSADADTDNTYMVTVNADDATYDVIIMVTDVDEVPTIEGDATIDYAENGTGDVATFTAMDPEGTAISWALSGIDAGVFDISAAGMLTFKESPDYEMPADADTDNTYVVTIHATDVTMKTGAKAIMVMVTDVDEVPTIEGDATIDYAENGTGDVATYTAMDPEEATITWSLAGTDAGVFDISGAGVLTFNESPDYEMSADADTDNTYMVTVEASDGTNMASHEVTVTVTDVSEMAPEMSLLEMYDENDNNRIDKNEVLAGVEDYIFRQTITREQVLELVELYIFG